MQSSSLCCWCSLSNTIKKLNKLVNADLKHLVYWLNANKISLIVKNTEMVIFKFKQKEFKSDSKIELWGKKLYPTNSVKYLGVKIDAILSWQYYGNDLSIKLNEANGLLFKMRIYVNLEILRSIYFTILDSCLSYFCSILWTVILQKKGFQNY